MSYKKIEVAILESSIYLTSKENDKPVDTEQSLKHAVSFLIKRSFFTIFYLLLKQDIGILMEICPAPFWKNVFLYFFDSLFLQIEVY